MARDYKAEYENYHGKAEQRKRRGGRVKARRMMEKAGKVTKGDGKDVDHKDRNPTNNSPKNLSVKSAAKNRGYPRKGYSKGGLVKTTGTLNTGIKSCKHG